MNTPMLAATIRTEDDLSKFPLLATPKVDGVRALVVGGRLVSRTLKPIPIRRIRAILENLLPEGADGEIFCKDLYTTTSTVMSFDAEGEFMFFWFDWAYDVDAPYRKRALSITNYMAVHKTDRKYVSPLMPRAIHNINELYAYERQALDQGFEGIMLRVPDGRYKSGRSTIKEGLLVKLKRFADSEAIIIGAEELIHRTNPDANEPGDILGAIVAEAPDGTVFKIGTGYTADQRLALWANRDVIVGKTIKYRYAEKGSKNRPRCPVFLGLRHNDDM